MERIHVNYIRDILYRLRCGQSERQIAHDLGLSRPTVHKYKVMAAKERLLDQEELPGAEQLAVVLGPVPQPPKTPSTLEPHRKLVERMLDEGVEMTAMWQGLRDDHGYSGSYSSVRRFVHRMRRWRAEARGAGTAPGSWGHRARLVRLPSVGDRGGGDGGCES